MSMKAIEQRWLGCCWQYWWFSWRVVWR